VKILLDLGNSRCKFAIVENSNVQKYDAQDYGPFGKLYSVKSLCDQYNDASGIIISSVLSEKMNLQIKETLLGDSSKSVYFLAPAENSFGVKLAYTDLSSLGVDRIAALIAANEKYSGNTCIVDCGTAVTIDALDAKGVHQGGVILPGVESMRKALLSNTKIEIDVGAKVEFDVLSKTTESAIHSGCISAVVGGIEYVINKMASGYDSFDQVVLTGGDAERIRTYLSQSAYAHVHETLVLDGLKVVSQHI
jgi:type III pantothenate kinase